VGVVVVWGWRHPKVANSCKSACAAQPDGSIERYSGVKPVWPDLLRRAVLTTTQLSWGVSEEFPGPTLNFWRK